MTATQHGYGMSETGSKNLDAEQVLAGNTYPILASNSEQVLVTNTDPVLTSDTEHIFQTNTDSVLVNDTDQNNTDQRLATNTDQMVVPTVAPTSNIPYIPIQPQNAMAKFSTWADRPKDNVIIMAFALCLIAIYAALNVFSSSYDNDVWFFLSTGREIVENGIPYENPFTFLEGMSIIVQQWLHCVITYVLYINFGFVGLGIWVTILFACMVFSLFKVGRIMRGDKFGGEVLLLLIIPTIFPLSLYSSVRPHLYTMIIFIWVVGFLELYRKSSKIGFLVPLPFIAALHINLQASLAPFDLVIIICYLIPDFMNAIHRDGFLKWINFLNWDYRRIPILIVLPLCAIAFLANPYFLDGALYLVKSYDSASYGSFIREMYALSPGNDIRLGMSVVMMILAAVCIGLRGLKKLDFPLLLLVIGTSIFTFIHSRNVWLGPLFCYLYIAKASVGTHIELPRSIVRFKKPLAALGGVIGVVAFLAISISAVPRLNQLPENDTNTPVAAMDYLDEIGANKETTKVFNYFNAGGYIEYRGYKVSIDPRPEIWSPSISGADFDYYKEFVDMFNGEIIVDEYVRKYGYNVFIVPKTYNDLNLFKDQNYYFEISGGDGYRAFIKKSAYEEMTGQDIKTAPDPVLYRSKTSE